jgi:hypothetical protein
MLVVRLLISSSAGHVLLVALVGDLGGNEGPATDEVRRIGPGLGSI